MSKKNYQKELNKARLKLIRSKTQRFNAEQQAIYEVFIGIRKDIVINGFNNTRFLLHKGYEKNGIGTGAEHILLGHFSNQKEGELKPDELLNLGKFIRAYQKQFNKPYNKGHKSLLELRQNKSNFKIVVCDKLMPKLKAHKHYDYAIISFFSDRNYHKEMIFENAKVKEYYEKNKNLKGNKMTLHKDDTRAVLEHLGFEVDNNYKFKMRADERTKSASIDPRNGYIKDFGSGFRGDVIAFFKEIKNCDDKTAFLGVSKILDELKISHSLNKTQTSSANLASIINNKTQNVSEKKEVKVEYMSERVA